MTNSRLRVLYYDDQEVYRQTFRRRHQGKLEVETASDIGDALRNLRSREPSDLPDLLLLDLYHPAEPSRQDDDQQRCVKAAQAALDELDEAIERAGQAVSAAWQPLAIDVIEEIRKHYSPRALPIAIYSRKGLLLLDDEQMQRIEHADVEYVLKDPRRYSEETERMRMRGLVRRYRASDRMARDVKIALYSVAAGLLGSAATLSVQGLIG